MRPCRKNNEHKNTMNWTTIRSKTLQFITGLGAFVAALGTLPVDSADLPMPENWRPYIISVGFIAMTVGQWLPLLGDLIDDGIKNDSFKLLIGLLCLSTISCSEFPVTGTIYFRDQSSGAKGGLTFTPNQPPQASVLYPVYDADNNQIGLVDIVAEIPVTPEK